MAKAGAGQSRTRALLMEVEGVAIAVREAWAAAIREVLEADHAAALTHGFLCRHLLQPDSRQVAASVARDLGLRATGRHALEKAIAKHHEKAMSSDSNLIREGLKALIDHAQEVGFSPCLVGPLKPEAWNACVQALELDPELVTGVSWSVGEARDYTEGWRGAARAINREPAACVAAVSTAASARGALLAGYRCIAVPDRYSVHQDFGGVAAVAEEPGDIDVSSMIGLGAV